MFDCFNNTGAIDVKINRSILEEKSYFKMLGLTFSSNLDWGSYIIAIVKTTSKKIGALIRSMKFLSPEFAFYLYKSGLVPLVATWNCGISYKNNMQGCWSFTCCLSRTLGLSLKCSQLESSIGITFVDVYLN